MCAHTHTTHPLFSKLTAQSCNLYKECKGPTQYTRRHSPTLVPSKSDAPCGSFHLYFENRTSLLDRALLGDPKCRNRSVVLLLTLPKCHWQFSLLRIHSCSWSSLEEASYLKWSPGVWVHPLMSVILLLVGESRPLSQETKCLPTMILPGPAKPETHDCLGQWLSACGLWSLWAIEWLFHRGYPKPSTYQIVTLQ